jgi:hypothetical protein
VTLVAFQNNSIAYDVLDYLKMRVAKTLDKTEVKRDKTRETRYPHRNQLLLFQSEQIILFAQTNY